VAGLVLIRKMKRKEGIIYSALRSDDASLGIDQGKPAKLSFSTQDIAFDGKVHAFDEIHEFVEPLVAG